MPTTLKLNVTKAGGVHFDDPIPQIERGREFEVTPGNWDPELVNRVTLSKFHSLVFDHHADKFVEGDDEEGFEYEFVSDANANKKWNIAKGGLQKFHFKNDSARVTPDKHRLIEYEMEIETPDGKTLKIDPTWDEKP